MKKLLFVFSLCALLAISAFGAKNPWVGIWKLDLAKSHFTGYTINFSPSADGSMLLRTSASAMTVHFDGREHPGVMANRTSAWTSVGENAWDSVTRAGGTVVAKTHREIAGDGKTLTRTSEVTRRDGTTAREVETFTRVDGTKGLAGTWRSTKQTRSAEDIVVVLPAADGSFRSLMPDFKETVDGKMDGSDIPIKGSIRLPGASIAITKASARKIEYTIKSNGKALYKGYQTLSAQGNTLTDVSWVVGKEEEKTTGVYIKQ